MAVDPLQHDRPVADDRVEVGGGREALVRPQLLVPAEADDPLSLGMRGGIVAQPLLQVGERAACR